MAESVLPADVVRSYLKALESNDPGAILAHFAPGAEIVSPTYGRMRADEFYAKLCADTQSVKIAVQRVNHAAADPGLVFAHFDYTWALKDGVARDLEILDLFEIEDGTIRTLRIFADGKK